MRKHQSVDIIIFLIDGPLRLGRGRLYGTHCHYRDQQGGNHQQLIGFHLDLMLFVPNEWLTVLIYKMCDRLLEYYLAGYAPAGHHDLDHTHAMGIGSYRRSFATMSKLLAVDAP